MRITRQDRQKLNAIAARAEYVAWALVDFHPDFTAEDAQDVAKAVRGAILGILGPRLAVDGDPDPADTFSREVLALA